MRLGLQREVTEFLEVCACTWALRNLENINIYMLLYLDNAKVWKGFMNICLGIYTYLIELNT